uniref:Uncharacterized protein n=1 Tax=African swine fever virus TaxID=10497 RepID=A0A8A8SG80_ASF|nr:hypothetical protein [African swine fever virus]
MFSNKKYIGLINKKEGLKKKIDDYSILIIGILIGTNILSLTVVISIIHLFTTCVPQHNHSTHFPYLNRVLHPNHVRHPNHVLHLNHVLQLNPILHPNHYLVSRYYPISRHYLPKIFRLFT